MNDQLKGPICFVSYNSAISPLLNSQGVPHLIELARMGWNIILITYEKRQWTEVEREQAERLAVKFHEVGIQWRILRHTSSFFGVKSLWDIIRGGFFLIALRFKQRISLIHARSYIPAIMALIAKFLTGVPYIFDMRGLQPDEYVDEGLWQPASLKYKMAKKIERILLKFSNAVVVVSEPFADAVKKISEPKVHGKISIIYNCVSTKKFKNCQKRQELLDGKVNFIYCGSAARWHLIEEMIDFFITAKKELDTPSRLVLLIYEDLQKVKMLVNEKGLGEDEVIVTSVQPDDVPGYLCSCSVGLSFIKNTFSKEFAIPIKFGEYLAAGIIPVVNSGVATATIVKEHNVGIVVNGLDRNAMEEAAKKLKELLKNKYVPDKARNLAYSKFSLSQSVKEYNRIYLEILNKDKIL